MPASRRQCQGVFSKLDNGRTSSVVAKRLDCGRFTAALGGVPGRLKVRAVFVRRKAPLKRTQSRRFATMAAVSHSENTPLAFKVSFLSGLFGLKGT
jgi:hypothetical protein